MKEKYTAKKGHKEMVRFGVDLFFFSLEYIPYAIWILDIQ